jgi:TonB-dependent starch-binding outer membrane protein SusC
MKSVNYLLFLIIFVFSTAGAFSQSGTLTGVVRDATTGELLPGANIQIEGTAIGTVTNTNGEYRMMNLPQGKHTLPCFFYRIFRIQRRN